MNGRFESKRGPCPQGTHVLPGEMETGADCTPIGRVTQALEERSDLLRWSGLGGLRAPHYKAATPVHTV